MKTKNNLQLTLLNNVPIIIFIVFFVITGLLEPKFFSMQNVENIFKSSSHIGVLAIGMTFVLLTGGIDLSVGSTMYLSAGLVGVLTVERGFPIWLAIVLAFACSLVIGLANGILVAKLKLLPFLATMAMQVLMRGVALLVTESRPIKLPQAFSGLGSVRLFGLIPVPIALLLFFLLIAAIFLSYTAKGRQIYAVGNNEEAARLAGINKDNILLISYVLCSVFACAAGLIAVTQYGLISAAFGEGIEFNAIAAAVLGGVSLAGGVGKVFPGTLIGTLLIQMIQIALVYLKVDLYITSIISALVIFVAVFLDSFRLSILRKMERRHIFKA